MLLPIDGWSPVCTGACVEITKLFPCPQSCYQDRWDPSELLPNFHYICHKAKLVRGEVGASEEYVFHRKEQVFNFASHDPADILFDFSVRGPDVMPFFEFKKVTVNKKDDLQC
jgi:hypothetical protein